MENEEEKSPRDKRGRFVAGHSHNKGVVRSRTRLLRVASEEEIDQIIRGIVDDALNGDASAREWVGARVAPPARPMLEKTRFEMDTSSLEAAGKSILQAISDGTIAPDVGESLMRSLNAAGSLGQMQQLSQRLADLEQLVRDRNTPKDVTPLITQQEQEDAPERPERPSWRDHAMEVPDHG